MSDEPFRRVVGKNGPATDVVTVSTAATGTTITVTHRGQTWPYLILDEMVLTPGGPARTAVFLRDDQP